MSVETSAFYGKTPWNGGTKVLDPFCSPSEFMTAAGLDWKVNVEKLYLGDGTEVVDNKVTRRESDGKILGVVGNRYNVLQNSDAFDWFAPFIESKQASWETAGALKEGRVIWCLANTAIAGEVVKGDEVKSYILLSHSHDGTLSIRSGFTNIRVVCKNTLAAALKDKEGKLLKVRHTKNHKLALDKVREIMDVANQNFQITMEQYRYLASKGVNQESMKKYINDCLVSSQAKEKDEDAEVRQSTVESILTYFENGRGNQYGKGTVWNAYNGITEFLTWEKGKTPENRLHSLWFGLDQATNQKALEFAVKLADGTL